MENNTQIENIQTENKEIANDSPKQQSSVKKNFFQVLKLIRAIVC